MIRRSDRCRGSKFDDQLFAKCDHKVAVGEREALPRTVHGRVNRTKIADGAPQGGNGVISVVAPGVVGPESAIRALELLDAVIPGIKRWNGSSVVPDEP
jgi:hypothetical protein